MAIKPMSYANIVFPLCKEEEQIYSRCTSDAPQHIVHRYLEYYMQEEEARKDFLLKCGGYGAGAAALAVGSLWMLKTLLTSETKNSNTENQDVNGSKNPALRMGLCGLIGFQIGALIGGYWSVRTVAYSTEFGQWKDQAIRDKIFPLFQKFLEASELTQFLCPISLLLINIPVKDPKGRWYEKDMIEGWISQKNREPMPNLATLPTEADRDKVRFRTSPFTDMSLQIGDLTYDGTYHVKVAKAIRELFDKQIDQQVKDGLFAYYNTIRMDRAAVSKAIAADIWEKWSNGEISDKEFYDATQACKNHYKIPPLENRDQKI